MESPCYGTNVHPAEDLRGILSVLEGPAAAVRRRFRPDGVLGLGLWLPAAAARELAGSDGAAAALRERCASEGLRVATVNAFPWGGFHDGRVKEEVYRPDWADPRRLEYARDVGRALARLLDPGTTCVASTVPGTWKGWSDDPSDRRTLARGLAAAASTMADLRDASGVRVVLAPEPEPGCTLETAEETVAFWRRDLLPALGTAEGRLLAHLGVCLDLCHAAVVEEDPVAAVRRLRAGGVPVAKVQVSAALAVDRPAANPEVVEALRRFDEPRWLHQVAGRSRLGVLRRAMDLPEVFASLDAWTDLPSWRVHFHAPLDRDEVAGVPTTRDRTVAALREILAGGGPAPVFEVETYTWSAVPGFEGGDEALAERIAAELAFAERALADAPAMTVP